MSSLLLPVHLSFGCPGTMGVSLGEVAEGTPSTTCLTFLHKPSFIMNHTVTCQQGQMSQV